MMDVTRELRSFLDLFFLDRSAFDMATGPDESERWRKCNLDYAMYVQENSEALSGPMIKLLSAFETQDWHDSLATLRVAEPRDDGISLLMHVDGNEVRFDSVTKYLCFPANESQTQIDLIALECVDSFGRFGIHVMSSVCDLFIECSGLELIERSGSTATHR